MSFAFVKKLTVFQFNLKVIYQPDNDGVTFKFDNRPEPGRVTWEELEWLSSKENKDPINRAMYKVLLNEADEYYKRVNGKPRS